MVCVHYLFPMRVRFASSLWRSLPVQRPRAISTFCYTRKPSGWWNMNTIWMRGQCTDQDFVSPQQENDVQQQFQNLIGGPLSSLQEYEELKGKAKAGDLQAQTRLGVSYLYGVDGLFPPDVDRGLETLYNAGTKGFAQAFCIIGRYWSLEGHERKAYPWFERASQMGDAGACWERAIRLESGKGVPKDFEAVREFFFCL